MTSASALNVAVIGAGIVGLCAALEIQHAGHAVTLIEPDEPGGRQAASYGNAGWINPGALPPIALPGLWRKAPRLLLDPRGPFTVRWRDFPGLAPWLARFIASGRDWDRVEICARHRLPLCVDTVDSHLAYAREAQAEPLVRRAGLIYVYPDRAAYDAEARVWALRRKHGVRFSEIEENELRRLVPSLSPRYKFAARLDDAGQVVDPGAYCAALARRLARRGARRVVSAARGLDIAQGRLRAVLCESGAIACERAVIAAGMGSGALAAAAGDRAPLAAERGYHVVIPDPGFSLDAGLMPSDGQMGVVSTPQGLRLAGQVELAAVAAAPDWARAEILFDCARRMFPDHAARFDAARLDRWMGCRPSTPDGLPCIGPASGCGDVIHAFGHAHTGMAQAPATARLVASIIAGRAPPFDPSPYSVRRFRR